MHISIAKAGLQFLNDLFYQKIPIYPAKFPNDLFLSVHKQPFINAHLDSLLHISIHRCTFRFITAHFDSSLHISIHHCTFCAPLNAKTSPASVSSFVNAFLRQSVCPSARLSVSVLQSVSLFVHTLVRPSICPLVRSSTGFSVRPRPLVRYSMCLSVRPFVR